MSQYQNRGNNGRTGNQGRGSSRGFSRNQGYDSSYNQDYNSYTLKSLVDELKNRADNGESQESIIGWLHNLVSSLNIQMRYDIYENKNSEEEVLISVDEKETPAKKETNEEKETTSEKKKSKSQATKVQFTHVPITLKRGKVTINFDDDALREYEAPSNGGRFEHLADGELFVGRIILSCNMRNASNDYILCAECNGAIIDAREWKILVTPPRSFNPQASVKEINKNLASDMYDIIPIIDGTVVSLYCWKHPTKGSIWCLSSSNGYDVSHLKWMGSKTYAEIVYELFNQKAIEETGINIEYNLLCEGDTRLSFTNLDQAYSYTIGFRHENFHPLKDIRGIWNIHSSINGNVEYIPRNEGKGIPYVPCQEYIDPEDIMKMSKARRGRNNITSPVKMHDINIICKDSLDYALSLKDEETPDNLHIPKQFKNTIYIGWHHDYGIMKEHGHHYGFILRSKNTKKTGSCSDILYESPLFRRVRQLIYQKPLRKINEELDETNRLEYRAMKAYLTITDRDEFISLFPQFKHRFDIYKEFMNNITHLILQMHRHNTMSSDSTKTSNKKEKSNKSQTKIIAKALLSHIMEHEKDFKAFNTHAKSIVQDFVVRPEYAMLYLKSVPPSS